MTTIQIQTIDRQQNLTTDTTAGSPIVYVKVDVSGVTVLAGMPALIDTGAEYTLVSTAELQLFAGQLRVADRRQMTDPILIGEPQDVYEAIIEIVGFNNPITIFVIASAKTGRHPMLIGRNLLKYYRLVYDPTKPELTLTEP